LKQCFEVRRSFVDAGSFLFIGGLRAGSIGCRKYTKEYHERRGDKNVPYHLAEVGEGQYSTTLVAIEGGG